jgi:hypothetical protein
VTTLRRLVTTSLKGTARAPRERAFNAQPRWPHAGEGWARLPPCGVDCQHFRIYRVTSRCNAVAFYTRPALRRSTTKVCARPHRLSGCTSLLWNIRCSLNDRFYSCFHSSRRRCAMVNGGAKSIAAFCPLLAHHSSHVPWGGQIAFCSGGSGGWGTLRAIQLQLLSTATTQGHCCQTQFPSAVHPQSYHPQSPTATECLPCPVPCPCGAAPCSHPPQRAWWDYYANAALCRTRCLHGAVAYAVKHGGCMGAAVSCSTADEALVLCWRRC